VDAFVGSSKIMTQVIAEECTGCDLCLPVCPVDCIDMVESKSIEERASTKQNESLNNRQVQERAIRDNWRSRFEFHQLRIERNKQERDELLKSKMIALKEKMAKDKSQKEKIDAAISRVNASKVDNEAK
jgi:electron transport complex protein RnfB